MKVKKNPKAELSRFSMIFFQIGMVVMLGLTYVALEWNFDPGEDMDLLTVEISDFEQEDVPVTQLNTPPPPPPPPPPPMPEVIEIIEDQKEVEETTIQSTESSQEERIEEIVQVEDIAIEEEEEEIANIPFMVGNKFRFFPAAKTSGIKWTRKIVCPGK